VDFVNQVRLEKLIMKEIKDRDIKPLPKAAVMKKMLDAEMACRGYEFVETKRSIDGVTVQLAYLGCRWQDDDDDRGAY
jgi:hypothetical protein